MKIKWILEEERVMPGVAHFTPGEVYDDIPDDIAQSLINEGMAKAVRVKQITTEGDSNA